MQDVNHQLFTESVSQEMSLSMKRFNLENSINILILLI